MLALANALGAGGIAPASAYAPTDLGAALCLWLDALDSATLYTDPTETTLATASNTVGRWKDKSGSGKHGDQNTIGARPTLTASSINTRQGLYYTTNDFLLTPAIGTTSAAVEVWFVALVSGVGTQTPLETSAGGAAAGSFSLFVDNTNTYFYDKGDVGYGSCEGGYDQWSPRLFIGTIDMALSSNEVNLSVDGTALAGHAYNANNTSTMTSQALYIGARSGTSNFFHGYMGEILVLNRALTGGERIALKTYLAAKWGLTVV